MKDAPLRAEPEARAMPFELVDPPLPTWARWRRMRAQGPQLSSLRQMEYARIRDLRLDGRVLDFGGGETTSYRPLLDAEGEVVSVNIDRQYQPTHVVVPGAPLPFGEAEFDTVVTFNVLEHVYDDVGAMRELARVLRPGGTLHVIVPFLFPVHGHPDDFNRHTPSWWAATLERLGFASARLTPLVFGMATTSRLVGGRGLLRHKGASAAVAAAKDILVARLSFPGRERYEGRRGQRFWAKSPGWHIEAVR